MAKRVCDVCGKEKDVSGGVTCSTGHFMCSSCKYAKGFLLDSKRTQCPICKKSLR